MSTSLLQWHQERLATEIEELQYFLDRVERGEQPKCPLVVAASKANIRYHKEQIEKMSA